MKTEQEIRQMVNTCNVYHSCALCPYRPKDISRFIGDRWKGGCPNYDRQLVYAMGKGYGDVSEYKAEIERLKAENCELTKKLEARLTCDFVKTAQKHAKIDILNKAKERIKTAIDTYFNLDGGGYYLAEGAIDDIDGLIEEVEE